jgi:hypothetical protein
MIKHIRISVGTQLQDQRSVSGLGHAPGKGNMRSASADFRLTSYWSRAPVTCKFPIFLSYPQKPCYLHFFPSFIFCIYIPPIYLITGRLESSLYHGMYADLSSRCCV